MATKAHDSPDRSRVHSRLRSAASIALLSIGGIGDGKVSEPSSRVCDKIEPSVFLRPKQDRETLAGQVGMDFGDAQIAILRFAGFG